MLCTSPTIAHISAALLTFQGAVDGVGRNASNPHFKNRYANLEAVMDTAKPELQKVGVLVMQSPGAIVEGNMSMTTRLIHAESGEWIEGQGDIPLGKRDPQGAGSAQTYAQRYHLMAMLGLPPIDDDGETAIDRNNARPEPSHGTGHEAPAYDGPRTQYKPSKAMLRAAYAEMSKEIAACSTLDELSILWRSPAFRAEYDKLPDDWQRLITADKDDRKRDLTPVARSLGEHLDNMERQSQ